MAFNYTFGYFIPFSGKIKFDMAPNFKVYIRKFLLIFSYDVIFLIDLNNFKPAISSNSRKSYGAFGLAKTQPPRAGWWGVFWFFLINFSSFVYLSKYIYWELGISKVYLW